MSVLVCPRPDELTGFRNGTLVLDRHLGVARHLKSCAACRQAVAALPTPTDNTPADDPTNPGLTTATAETELETPPTRQVGPYRLGPVLGKGGMGVVYEAVHADLGQPVALKVLPRPAPADPEAAARFRKEWQALGRLSHPNVVRALHAGDADGVPFLAMELVAGVDLGRVVQRAGPLAAADAAAVVRFTALGLAHAHALGVTHRDVKPGNVLLTAAGEVKLLDLGLAQLAGAGHLSSVRLPAGSFLGTADYMAPEQWDDPSAADARADVYALGCVLFYLLTGKPPFAAPDFRTPLDKKRAHLTAPPPNPGGPDGLVTVLRWMLQKDPIDRPQSAAVVADALAPFAGGANLPRLAAAADRDAVGGFEDGPRTRPAAAPPTRAGADEPPTQQARPRRRPHPVYALAAAPVLLAAGWGLLAAARPAAPVPAVEVAPVSPEPAAPARPAGLKPVAVLAGGRPASVLAFAADSRGLYAGTADGELVRWEVGSWAARLAFATPADSRGRVPVRAVAPVGVDGGLLVGGNSRVWLVDPAAGRAERQYQLPAGVWSLAAGSDGRHFAAGHATHPDPDGKPTGPVPAVTRWELGTGKPAGRWDGPAGRKVWVRPAAGRLLAADTAGDVLTIDPDRAAAVRATDPAGTHAVGLAVTAAGPLLFADLFKGREVVARRLDPATGAAVREAVTGRLGGLKAAAATPDGRTAVLGGYRGHLFVGDPLAGAYTAVPFAHVGGVGQVAVSPDGRLAATAGTDDGLVRVWELAETPTTP